MANIARDSDVVELNDPPRFQHGERVISRYKIRNDGTFGGREIGDVLVDKGDVGVVVSIGTFLQQFYIYEVEIVDRGYRVGMKSKELVSLDRLPEHVAEALGADKLTRLREIFPGSGQAAG